MMYYSGLVAIFENKEEPKLIANPKNQWFSFKGDKTLYFYNDFLFLRLEAYNKNPLLSGTPFVAIDLNNKRFGFIDFDASSIYYSLIPIDDALYRIHLDTPTALKNSKFINRERQTFDLSKVKYYDFIEMNKMKELYHIEKAGKK